MEDERFEQSLELPVAAERLHDWHMRPGAFARLRPPWEPMKIDAFAAEIADGGRSKLRVQVCGPLWRDWIAEYRDVVPGREFADVQVRGPFARWRHRHQFLAKGGDRSTLVDTIDYRLPLGPVGKLLAGRMVARRIARTFRYRHTVTAQDLTRAADRPAEPSLTILVTGASGMIGRALVPYLENAGHRVVTLSRTPAPDDPNAFVWDPDGGRMNLAPLGPIDGVIHLASENIGAGRWTRKRKERIFQSRKRGTRLLADALARLERPPGVLVTASGVNYYEPSHYSVHTEQSPPGTTFLADVCRVWEGETWPAREAGIRVVHLRMGMVLTPAGGGLARMLPIFKWGLGGRMGDGRQRMSWIAIDDAIDVFHRALTDPRMAGPINVASPQIVENRAFAAALGRVLRRPAILPVPRWALKLAFGEMATETVLPDLAAAPSALADLGYPFRFATLDDALAHVLGRDTRSPSPGLASAARSGNGADTNFVSNSPADAP